MRCRMIEEYERRGIVLDRMVYWEAKAASADEVGLPCMGMMNRCDQQALSTLVTVGAASDRRE